jgi:4-alpha-glucanotransferase
MDTTEEARLALELYAGRPVSSAEVSMLLIRMAFGSVATVAILPIQDLLNLDERARMNKPASIKDNWGWRLLPGQINSVAEENLKRWTEMYNRD